MDACTPSKRREKETDTPHILPISGAIEPLDHVGHEDEEITIS
jgi:hypothetical protein